MKNENKNRLQNLFTDLKERKNKAQVETDKRVNEQKSFVEEFEVLCKEIIEPLMNQYKDFLNENGYSSYIKYTPEGLNERNQFTNPQITMDISRSKKENFSGGKEYPHVAFIADKFSKKVTIHESTIAPNTGGHAGPRNTFSIKSLTKDIVEKEIVGGIESIFKG